MHNANLFHLQISTKTAVDRYNFICDVCAQYFPVKLGGPSIKVKIDKVNLVVESTIEGDMWTDTRCLEELRN